MSHILALAAGLPTCFLGLGLAIYSSVRTAKLRAFVIRNALSPEATKPYYLARFRMHEVLAAYESATGDHAAVRAVYVTGLAGMLCFVIGGLLVLSALPA